MKKTFTSGFTLVELMIVMSIIGILSAVLFPTVSKYLANARDTTLMTQVKKFVVGMDLYYNDAGAYPSLSSYTAGTEMPLINLSGALVPRYISEIPLGINGMKHKYTSYPNTSIGSYTILIYTEKMYGGQTSRGNTCIYGILNSSPIQYGVGHFSDAGVLQPICSF